MNTIYRNRIEEAAENAYPYYKYQSQKKEYFVKGAKWMFDNLWISVEEALPEEDMPCCFVAYKAMDMVLYSTGSYEKDNDEWYVDGVGFNAEVTYWMPIPYKKI